MQPLLVSVLLFGCSLPGDLVDDAVARRESAFSEELQATLERRDPQLGWLWGEAMFARENGEFEDAAEKFDLISEGAPDFSHAVRRSCWARLDLGQKRAAFDLCTRAVAIERSPENLVALATVLAEYGDTRFGREDGLRRGLRLALEAVAIDGDNYPATSLQCEIAFELENDEILQACAASMAHLAPERDETHFYSFVAAVYRSDFAAARQHLARRDLSGPEREDLTRALDERERVRGR